MSNLINYFKELGNKLSERQVLESRPVKKDEYLHGIAKGYAVPGTVTAQLIATSVFGNPEKFKLKVVQTAIPFATEFENAAGWTQRMAVKKMDRTPFTRAEAEKFIASFDGQDAIDSGFKLSPAATKTLRPSRATSATASVNRLSRA